MGLLDTFRGSPSEEDAEQLAASEQPAPRGESRESGWIVSTFGGTGWLGSSTSGTVGIVDETDDDLETVRSPPPKNLAEDHREYFKEGELPRAALKIFALTVAEPGYRIGATRDGDTDEEMQEALREWAGQCAIDACESGQDLSLLLKQAPILRYSKATAFIEKAGTQADPDALAALVYHKPETFTQYKRANKALLVQPDDPVGKDHPRTPPTGEHPDGKAAAYVQYDDALSGYDDDDSIAFGADDVIKLAFDADNGSAWGTPVWESNGDRIDALRQKWRDRDASIRMNGHPHRIYSAENMNREDAKNLADAHKEGEISAGPNVADHSNDREGYRQSFAGRVDFVSDEMKVKVAQGQVADIEDAVKDDIEAIFAPLPVAKPRVAYSQDVNQFSIDVLDEVDSRLVDEEREYLRRKFRPVIVEKADELAGGEYGGEVSFQIEPEQSSNPLNREDFPADNLDALTSSIKELLQAGADPALIDAVLSHAGIDREQIEEEYGDRYEADPLDEQDEQVQQQFAEGQQQGGETATDGGTEQ